MCDILGAGTNCKVIINILKLNHIVVRGIYDDDVTKIGTHIYNIPVLGTIQESTSKNIICSIGNNAIREQIISKINSLEEKRTWISAIHPKAILAEDFVHGHGCVICPGVVVQPNVKIGDHVILNTGSCIDHDCTIDSFSHIAPMSCLCGSVQIGKNVLVGAGSVVLPGIIISPNSIVGAGCTLRSDLLENSVYKE